jgi:uncharacterized protein YdhG (YjbR/CyaY superfamily)
METESKGCSTIDEYIGGFPADIQKLLQEMRAVIHAAAPEAKEIISYQMPTFELEGNLVYFAAAKHHIGFYPTSSGIRHFQERLAGYKGAKGSVQFPYTQPIPYDLVSEIVKFRVQENLAKAAARKKKKK